MNGLLICYQTVTKNPTIGHEEQKRGSDFQFTPSNLAFTCSKSITENAQRLSWHRSSVFIVNFEQILHIVLLFSLLTLDKYMPAGLLLCLKKIQ